MVLVVQGGLSSRSLVGRMPKSAQRRGAGGRRDCGEHPRSVRLATSRHICQALNIAVCSQAARGGFVSWAAVHGQHFGVGCLWAHVGDVCADADIAYYGVLVGSRRSAPLLRPLVHARWLGDVRHVSWTVDFHPLRACATTTACTGAAHDAKLLGGVDVGVLQESFASPRSPGVCPLIRGVGRASWQMAQARLCGCFRLGALEHRTVGDVFAKVCPPFRVGLGLGPRSNGFIVRLLQGWVGRALRRSALEKRDFVIAGRAK